MLLTIEYFGVAVKLTIFMFIIIIINKAMTYQKIHIVLVISLFIASCSSDNKSKKDKSNIDKELEVEDEFVNDLNKAKQVFYALPSPVETAMLIKRTGTDFDARIANPVENAPNYSTNFKKALNFGVYGADLSYVSLFGQTQASMQYMGVSKKLADELGILGFINQGIMERLEKNVTNRDSAMQIITEGFLTANEHLKEAGRPETAVLIISGGWIEGLYIATALTKNTPNNNELIDRIIDQKLSLITLMSLLKDYNKDKNIALVYGWMTEIEGIYNQIQVVTSKIEPITNEGSNVTVLKAKTDIFISEKVFNALCTKVDSIRNVITGI
jgi:hypothetical protein